LAKLRGVGGQVVVPQVGDVLQEQRHQDVVLVLRRVDGAAEGVAGGPGGLVDLLLGELVAHGWVLSESWPPCTCLARASRICTLRFSAARLTSANSRSAKVSRATIVV